LQVKQKIKVCLGVRFLLARPVYTNPTIFLQLIAATSLQPACVFMQCSFHSLIILADIENGKLVILWASPKPRQIGRVAAEGHLA